MIYLSIFLVFTSLTAHAQLVELPLKPSPQRASGKASIRHARTLATPLTLPFFDDFSTSFMRPDTTLWEKGGGTFVNTTSAANPPSKGVVSFDGLNFQGVPYNFGVQITQGSTDTLTSLPIDLSVYQPLDSLYLSFFWQAKGLGELPDPTDSLVLEFRTAADTWVRVWSERGQDMTEFAQKNISLASAVNNYFHEAFQFRFRMYGRPSGPYDTWHIDYIYLNRGRSAGDIYTRDVAIANQSSRLLKRYSSMPLEQYMANPAAETAESVSASLYNLYNQGIFTSYVFSVRNKATNQTYFTENGSAVAINARSRQDRTVNLNPANLLPVSSSPMIIEHKMTINAGDGIVNGVDFRRNDTISGTTVLGDFFAYDDGSAEYGMGIRQRQGKVACKFVLNAPDNLTAVKFYFTHLEQDLRGQTFVLSVWKQLDNQKESILYQKSVPVQYGDSVNAFITYELDHQVPLADTFYVGWQQSTDDLLAVGLDKNTDSGDQLFYDTNGRWEPNTEVQGSAMIRPVFGVSDKPVGLEDEKPFPQAAEFDVFPNPTSGLVQWRGDGASRVEIYDVIGRRIKELPLDPDNDRQLDLSSLSNGIYVLRFSFPRHQVAKRIVIQK